MTKNGILAVVIVVSAVLLIGLWVLRTGQQRAGARQFDCAAAPGTPGAFAAEKVRGDLARLSWSPPTSTERPTSYIMEVGSGTGRNDMGTFTAAGSTTSMDREAPPGTYYVRLYARNACGTSPPTTELVVTMP